MELRYVVERVEKGEVTERWLCESKRQAWIHIAWRTIQGAKTWEYSVRELARPIKISVERICEDSAEGDAKGKKVDLPDSGP